MLHPKKLELANLPTPLAGVSLPNSLLKTDHRLFLKRDDLTGGMTSGNKIRKLEYLLCDARQQGADVIITCGGLHSNHCRSTAFASCKLGLKTHLILREGDNPTMQDETGNLWLDKLTGASISYLSSQDYRRNFSAYLASITQSYAKQGLKTYFIPTGGSNALGLWGYIDAFDELHQQLTGQGTSKCLIACAAGSGGTLGGVALGNTLRGFPYSITGFAVCDSTAYFKRKIDSDIAQWCIQYEQGAPLSADYHVIDEFIGPGYAQAGPEIYRFIIDFTQATGIVLDSIYTGKALYGLLTCLNRGDYSEVDDIVFIHTGGSLGVFANQNNFDSLLQG